MKSKVEQYAKGDFYVEYPDMKLSKSYLQLKIEAGNVHTGTITVTSENGVPMKMMVYDDAYFLTLSEHSLIGTEGEITYSFDGSNKTRGSVYQGNIYLIGNGREIAIPYNIEIVAPFIDVNGVALEDLMKFSALAETNWERAIEIFYSEEFARTLLAENEDYLEAYRSLMHSVDRNQALEEFLVYIHKKRALTLQVEHDRFWYNYPKLKETHQFTLKKNTWGYCRMRVYSDSKFIIPNCSEICSMDFSGDGGVVEYTLDPEYLNHGNAAEGHIILENTYQKIQIHILIRQKKDDSRALVQKNSDHKLKKAQLVALMHNYLDYRIGKLQLGNFIQITRQILHQLVVLETGTGVYKLGLLHMSILAGQEENVKQEMRRMEADMDKTMEGVKEHCYWLYLKALLYGKQEQITHACEEIEKALSAQEDKLFYFWLLINLDKRYQEDRQWMFSQIEGLHMGGYESPVLTLEVCELFNEEPVLLKKLSSLELAALRFGIRNNYLSKEVEEAFLQLASKQKEFSQRVFLLLTALYKRDEKPELIQIICGMLIRGGRLERRYHSYYLEGIKCGYKLVGIQENYLRTMDKSRYDRIPDSVLRYFNYKSFLTDNEYAYLYANVIVNRRFYLAQYDEYLPNMMSFMEGQILKGNMSDDLSVIYSEFLRPQAVTPHYASKLVNVIFKRKLTVANDNIIAVVVSHRELEDEKIIPVTNRVAYVDLVTEAAVVSLVDKNRNRYISTIPYTLQKLVDETGYIDLMRQYAGDDYRYVLYRYDELGAYDARDAREVNVARDILAFRETSTETKQQAIMGIVRYYREHLDMDILRSYLDRVDMEYVQPKDSVEFIDNLILCGLYDKAYQAVKRFGYQDVKNEHLVSLVEAMKEFSQFAKEETLISIAAYLYRSGHTGVAVLSYLTDYYQSGLKDMLKLWKRASGRLTKLEGLEENILCETLYTEQWNSDVFKVFESYARKKNRGIVMKAFYKRAAFAFLVEDVDAPDSFFDDLLDQVVAQGWDDDVCQGALLLHMSRKIKLETQEVLWLKACVESFVKRGILLPFFRNFKKYLRLPKDLFFMTYVVTRDKAGQQISFQYGIQSGVGKPECNKTARMMEALPGYYMKEFVLFHGENLLYEMPEGHENQTKIYESEGMKAKGETEQYENRFEMLNSMLLNQEIGANQVLIDKIDKYLKLSALMEENLELIE